MRWIVITLTALIVAGAGAWWLLGRLKQTEASDQGTYVSVQRRDLVATVTATGKVTAMVGAEVRVGSRVSGRVQRLHANIGDVVAAGQVIAELEKDDQQALLEQRRAELKVAEARLSSVESLRPREVQKAEAVLADTEATAELAKTEFGRQSALLARGLIAKQILDSATKERDVTEARVISARRELELAKQRYIEDLKSAKAQIEQAAAAVRVLEAQVEYATIRAPIPGIISAVSTQATQAGETVAAGLNSPIFVIIVDLRKLQVDAFVDETDIGKIRVGQKAAFTVDSYPDRDFNATVQAIYPKAVIMDNVVYYDVVLHIDEPLTGQLRPEMTTSVILSLDARKGVLAAPLRAVSREQGKSVVYVLRNGQAARQTVKVGLKDPDWIEIVSGLQENDKVLIRSTPKATGGA
ncbi:MAG: efflux RND transporter periplasmic adaptor subunit [Armatimonadetes bacterium]|nr:efflux RND transporter periplasmic adaptor subunit [Armatimonadota bacterium]